MNPPNNQPPPEFVAIVDRVCWGEAETHDLARLEQYLADDASLWPVYFQALHTHHCLRQRFGTSSEVAPTATARVAPARPRPARPSRRTHWRAALAGGLLAAGLAVVIVTLSRNSEEEFARLTLLQGELATRDQASFRVGERVELRAGLAELRLASGAMLLLEGPADVQFEGPGRCDLQRGRMSVRSFGNGSVAISTRTALVTESGSEFGVEVESSGATTVQVYSGSVSVGRLSDPDSAKTLPAGHSVRIGDATDPAPRAVAFVAGRFIREMPPSETRPGSKDQQKLPYNDPQLRELRVPWVATPPVPDGDLADWPAGIGFTARCVKPFASDYHVAGLAAYDATHLYIAAAVADPHPMLNRYPPHAANHPWSGGGLIVRLGTDASMGWPVEASDPSRGKVPVGPLDRSERLLHLLAWYSEPTRESCLEVSHGMDYHGAVRNPLGVRAAHRVWPDGRGYNLEYAIPWTVLGGPSKAPRPGDVTSMCWIAHWGDSTGRIWRGQLVEVTNPAHPGWNFHHAATWGKAIWLAPEGVK